MRLASTVIVSAALLTSSIALADANHQLRGEVASFDPAARTLVVKETKAPRTEMHFTLADSARIIAMGKPGTPADLASGEHVKVSYTDQGANHQATRVEILREKAPVKKSQ